MMAREEELLNIIQKLVEEKTFSIEGVKAIEQLRRQLESNETELKGCKDRINNYVIRSEEAAARELVLKRKTEEYEKREKDIEAKEKNHAHMDQKVAVAEVKAYTLENVMQLLFKNTIVREHVQRSVVSEIPPAYPGSQPMTFTRQGDTDIKTTEKE